MSEASGLTIAPAAARSIAGIAAFRDHAALLAALHDEFGAAAPATPGFVQAGPITLSCLAPCRYLAAGSPDTALAARLAKSLAGLAAITDQSDLWEILILSGRGAADALSRLVPVDLSEAKFPIGALALTRAGHLDARLWRVAEQHYEIAVARSFAADLHWSLRQAERAASDRAA